MNKIILENEDNNTYKTIKEYDLLKRFYQVKFKEHKDLILGKYFVAYLLENGIWKYTAIKCNSNKNFKRYKKHLNKIGFVYKYWIIDKIPIL